MLLTECIDSFWFAMAAQGVVIADNTLIIADGMRYVLCAESAPQKPPIERECKRHANRYLKVERVVRCWFTGS